MRWRDPPPLQCQIRDSPWFQHSDRAHPPPTANQQPIIHSSLDRSQIRASPTLIPHPDSAPRSTTRGEPQLDADFVVVSSHDQSNDYDSRQCDSGPNTSPLPFPMPLCPDDPKPKTQAELNNQEEKSRGGDEIEVSSELSCSLEDMALSTQNNGGAIELSKVLKPPPLPPDLTNAVTIPPLLPTSLRPQQTEKPPCSRNLAPGFELDPASRDERDSAPGDERILAPGEERVSAPKTVTPGAFVMLLSIDDRQLDLEKQQSIATKAAFGEFPMVARLFRYYGGWSDKIQGLIVPADTPHHVQVWHEPIGVAGQIIQWNFPLLMFVWKVGPALACGNSIVLKTAEHTPLSVLLVAKLLHEAGLPDGVLNIISGYGPTVGAAIASHMDVDKFAFTGSTSTGKIVQEMAARSNLKPMTLELGGKSPMISMDDADIDKAVELAHFALFFNQGQCCSAGSRTFVHERIYDEFVEKAKARVLKRVVGDPFKKGVDARKMFDSICQKGMVPNVVTFNSLIVGLCQKGKVDDAFVLVSSMEANEQNPDSRTCNELIEGLCREDDGPIILVGSARTIQDIHDFVIGAYKLSGLKQLWEALALGSQLQNSSVKRDACFVGSCFENFEILRGRTSAQTDYEEYANDENKIFDPGICLLQQSLFQ